MQKCSLKIYLNKERIKIKLGENSSLLIYCAAFIIYMQDSVASSQKIIIIKLN